jgi:hypothetical protein
MRYLSTDASKNLSTRERDSLLATGMSIGLVWELGGARAGQGFAAGQADGHSATAQAEALGYPKTCPLFFAVDDGSLTVSGVASYFAGVRSTCGYPVGVYGSASVVEGIAGYKWQTCAWSGGRVSPHAHLYQRGAATVSYPISGTDENIVCIAFPLWSKSTAPVPPVQPPVQPPSHNVHQTTLIQQAVHIATDGVWGKITTQATDAVINNTGDTKYRQARVGTTQDGSWGPKSEAARVSTLKLLQSAIGVVPDGDWGTKSRAAWYVAKTNNYTG